MLVNLTIEENEDLHNHVKELISGQVRGILRTELSGIVATELGRMRLMQPGDTTLSDMIKNHVDKALTERVTDAMLDLKEEIRTTVKTDLTDRLRPALAELKKRMQERVEVAMLEIFKT